MVKISVTLPSNLNLAINFNRFAWKHQPQNNSVINEQHISNTHHYQLVSFLMWEELRLYHICDKLGPDLQNILRFITRLSCLMSHWLHRLQWLICL